MLDSSRKALDIINESLSIKERLKSEVEKIKEASELVLDALRKGKKVLLCGNGGSAADAQHISGELVHRLAKRRIPLSAIPLTANTSLLTAISNDDSFNDVFSRQLEGIGRSGDILIAISTSGRSPNIISAVKKASSMGIKTIGFTGREGQLKDIVDVAICVPSRNTQRIQECHILIGHVIVEVVEDAFS